MEVHSPGIPFCGPISSGLLHGNMVRIHGQALPYAHRFAINLQCGPNVNPRDDLALHFGVDFDQNCIIRNSLMNQMWGPEERHGGFPFAQNAPFEVLILCEGSQYKVAVNGSHFTEFQHRIPPERVGYLSMDGDMSVRLIQYDNSQGAYRPDRPRSTPPPLNYSGMPPSGPLPYPSYSPYPSSSGLTPPQPGYPMSSGSQGYPSQGPGYPMSSGSQGYPSQGPGYPTTSSYSHHQSKSGQGGILGMAAAAVGGVVGSALGRHGTSGNPSYPNSQHHSKAGILNTATSAVSGILGPALAYKTGKHMGMNPMYPAAGLAGAALMGSKGKHMGMNPMYPAAGLGAAGLAGAALMGPKGLKKQRKAQKKALKYGLPIAAVGGVGYAMHKGFKHHGGSSSSSSSSSD